MKHNRSLYAAVGMLMAASAFADVVSMAGNWRLNPAKSTWGKVRKPFSVDLAIEHQEPVFCYTGTVIYGNEDSRDFVFAGKIDGHEYPMSRSFGPGSASVRRRDDLSIVSTYTSADGLYTETATTSISADGSRLTRRVVLRLAGGERRWTEVYERR
jgi:hypothetical protein